MPKTKNAFALRDFDAENIWKQKFFKLGFFGVDDYVLDMFVGRDENKKNELKSLMFSDENILTMYCSEAIEAQKDYWYYGVKEILDSLEKMSKNVFDYQKKISRHSKRLEEYSRRWNEKICVDETISATEIRTHTRRIQGLLKSYADAQSAIKNLQRSIKRSVTEIVEGYEKADRKIFAIRLRQARTDIGYTQTELAEEIGMSQSTYTNYENSRCEPPMAVLKRLARTLGRSTDWLLGMTP